MKKNMGNLDKAIRILIALTISILYFTQTISGTAGMVLLIIGAVLLLTTIINFCPLYTILGINTCKTKPKKK